MRRECSNARTRRTATTCPAWPLLVIACLAHNLGGTAVGAAAEHGQQSTHVSFAAPGLARHRHGIAKAAARARQRVRPPRKTRGELPDPSTIGWGQPGDDGAMSSSSSAPIPSDDGARRREIEALRELLQGGEAKLEAALERQDQLTARYSDGVCS